jgi:hypothetical protein
VKCLSTHFHGDTYFSHKEKICRNVKIDSLLTIKLKNPSGIPLETEFIYPANIPDSVDIQGNCPVIRIRLRTDFMI